MRMSLLALVAATACKGETGVRELRRELSTESVTLDVGQVSVGDREPITLYLLSTGPGDVTVFDVSVDDPDHWGLSTSWSDGDGELKIDRGSESSPSYGVIELVFKPDSEGQFRTVLTVVSDDTEVIERDEDNNGIWKVVLRGIGQYPCGELYPQFHDFGPRPAGGYFTATSTIENCGGTLLTIADFEPESTVGGASSFSVSTPTPIYVLPGQSKAVELAFEPAGGSPPAGAMVAVISNAPSLEGAAIEVIGNDCEGSVDERWDSDNDGWFACGGDCNDQSAEVSPSVVERPANSIDDDCDGQVDEAPNEVDTDEDGDGFTETQGDCDDHDASIHPDATEVVNQVDDDCDGRVDNNTELYDNDGDGFSSQAGDCDDTDATIFPGAEDIENNLDDDCDGRVDEGSISFDDDGDGLPEAPTSGPSDCNDDDPWTYTGAIEDCDGLDNDCDGEIDEGEDGTADGACSFLVDRRESGTAAGGGGKRSCSASQSPRSGALGGFVLALALLWRRKTPRAS